jgi:hypothetical protein
MDELQLGIATVIERSEALLLRYFDGFDIFEWGDNDDKFLRRKAFAEVALYLSIAEMDSSLSDVLLPVADMTTVVCNSERFHRLMLRHQKEFLLFSSPILFCDLVAGLSESSRSVVERILQGRQVWSLERAPHRMMDMWHFCQCYGFPQRILVPQEIIRFGIPAFIDVINANLRDAYAFTHHFLFYYNFGMPRDSFPTEPLALEVGPSINALILRYVSENNCDIVAELVIVGLIHGQIDSTILYYATGWLLDKFAKYGFVPGPGVKDDEISEVDWKNHYHTILVSATMFRLVRKAAAFRVMSRAVVRREDAAFLREIGDVYNMLARNEIPLAIVSLTEMAPAHSSDELFRVAVRHIKELEYAAGDFGFWADEEAVFLRQGKTRGEFQSEIAQPLSSMCSELLTGLPY